MAILSVVSTASIARAGRFDAEYFSPEYLELASHLDRIGSEAIPEVCEVSDGNHLAISEHFSMDAEGGFRYLRGQDIGGFFLGDVNPVYVPKRVFDALRRSHMRAGDVLLVIVGATTGALSLVPDDTKPLTGSCKIAILRSRPGRIYAEYLAAFLASRYGQFQIRRQTRGAAQKGLILEDMRFIRVGRLGSLEDEITKQVRRAYGNLQRARGLYREAQSQVEARLGIREQSRKAGWGYEARLAALGLEGRWDAQCFHPTFLEYARAVQAWGATEALWRLVQPPVKGVQQRPIEDGNVEYASIKHIDEFEVVTDARGRLGDSGGRLAKPDDLVLAITGATIGKIGMVWRYERLAFSGDLIRLRTRAGIDSRYLLAVLGSRIGQGQMLRWVTGSTNGHLSAGDVLRTLIPRLGTEEAELSEKVAEALSVRREAAILLESAKQQIERAIAERAGRDSNDAGAAAQL